MQTKSRPAILVSVLRWSRLLLKSPVGDPRASMPALSSNTPKLVAHPVAIALGQFWIGLTLILLNRLADALDGAVARATTRTDRGGFLDIAFDFVVYAIILLAFAIYDALANALAAAVLLASYLANGSAFLAFSIMAERRGLTTIRHGLKSIYYLAGIAEGFETIVFMAAFCVWPGWFPHLATAFAALCFVSAAGRLVLGWKMLK